MMYDGKFGPEWESIGFPNWLLLPRRLLLGKLWVKGGRRATWWDTGKLTTEYVWPLVLAFPNLY